MLIIINSQQSQFAHYDSNMLLFCYQNLFAYLYYQLYGGLHIAFDLYQLSGNKLTEMGNSLDLTVDIKFMQKHDNYVNELKKQRPLFNIQDIKFPLSTKGIMIVDSTGRRVKLAGGNWSGAHMCRHCVDGLECRPLRDIALDIRYKFSMNCVRLTYSLQLFFDNKVVPQIYLKANPELKGKTAMEILDITVATLTEVGLMVILNNHTSTSQWCCSNDDGDGLWWSYEYPECMFFECAQNFATRYKDNPRVIGMDLRNQLRKAHGLQASWGDDNPLTDWRRAAKIAGEKVLKIAPHWLIIVSGLNYQLDLTPMHKLDLNYSVPNKLVYSGHFYSFSWPVPSWSLMTYQNFKKKYFNSQTFIRGKGYPFLLGEFGNNHRDTPWKFLMQYLKETDIDWTYWALDGFKCTPDKDQTYGVFTNDFMKERHEDMLKDMISVGPPPGTFIKFPLQLHLKHKSSLQQQQLKHLQNISKKTEVQQPIKKQQTKPQVAGTQTIPKKPQQKKATQQHTVTEQIVHINQQQQSLEQIYQDTIKIINPGKYLQKTHSAEEVQPKDKLQKVKSHSDKVQSDL